MLRPRRSTVLGLSVCVLLGAGVVTANAHVLSDPEPTAHELRLSFTDAAGSPAVTPYFAVTGAYPGMRRQVATATLANHGPWTIGYDVSVIVTQRGTPSLGDVLVARVSRDGHVVYHGPLSQLRIENSPPLAPNSAASYRVALSWPEGGSSDNQYQGTSLKFDLLARSRQAPDAAPNG